MKTPIEPMTVEEFFAQATKSKMGRLALAISLVEPEEEEGGGWRAAADGGISYGDTVGEAIRAAFDHVMKNPSQRARINPPFFTSDRDKPEKVMSLSYDYRAVDFVHPLAPKSDAGRTSIKKSHRAEGRNFID